MFTIDNTNVIKKKRSQFQEIKMKLSVYIEEWQKIKLLGAIFENSKAGIYVGSKGGNVLSRGVWGDYKELSSSETITWF